MPGPRNRHNGRQAAEALVRTAPLVSRWIERLLAGHEPPLTVAQYLALQAIGEGEVVGSELARRTASTSPAAATTARGSAETGPPCLSLGDGVPCPTGARSLHGPAKSQAR